MSFISFHENYYRTRLETFENKELTCEEIYEAQQLLKVLDDLADEGYTTLNDYLENKFSCLTRFRALLQSIHEQPFQIQHRRLSVPSFDAKEYELESLLDQLIANPKLYKYTSHNAFIKDINAYSHWIGYDAQTAYVFLLRDTLLPYVYFKLRHRKHLYPWLISRDFLKDVTHTEQMDDAIRLPIYEALEYGHIPFTDFAAYCKNRIQSVLDQHETLKSILCNLLNSIKEKRIVVIESGYVGTIPMMLMTLDDRVSFKLYTTAPFLYATYKDCIFCRKYEDIRHFETVYSQDSLLRYSSFHHGSFFVNQADSAVVVNKSLEEIKATSLT